MRADPFYSLSLSSSLDAITSRQDNLTSQLSSGLAVSNPGDDPLAASQAVSLSSGIARDDAYVQSATSLEGRMQTSDSALGSVVSEITSAIALATGGLNGTLSSTNLADVGTQLAAIRDQVVSLANTSYAGSYLFSGTSTATKPFAVDTTTSPATTTYSGDESSTYAATPGGQKIAVGLPGSQIFSASGSDVLGSRNALIADFASGTVSNTAQTDMNALSSGLTQVTSQRAVLGASLSTLEQTSTYAQTDETNLKATQSSLVSADTASIATELSTSETQGQALMSVMSNLGSKSLFDYMQE
jgi:flagellar hook-associated protein 3 FlgL